LSLFELRSLTKEFPGVKALKEISFSIDAGEILALVGENGAGKSTLLRLLNGDYKLDGGGFYQNGNLLSFSSPADAHRSGIRVIYQEPEVVPDLSVAENIYLGELPKHAGVFTDWRRLYQMAQTTIESLGVDTGFSADDLTRNLSVAKRQMVEILRALKSGHEIKLLALDEPTSSLSDEEARVLLNIVRRLRDEGVAIIYVSHRLKEIMQVADRIVVLRDGELVATLAAEKTSRDELVSLMVGRPVSNLYRTLKRGETKSPEIALRVRNLNAVGIHDVSFEIHKGEIVGFAGLVGAGRSRLARSIFGENKVHSGEIEVNGALTAGFKNPGEAITFGIGLAPEDRKRDALISMRSVKENISLSVLDRLGYWIFVRKQKENDLVSSLTSRLAVKTPNFEQKVRNLSGGNQQKVVLSRWLAREPSVLILDEPTRGIDVGAKAEIYKLIEDLAKSGLGIMLISSELPEVLGMSDRIIVMQNGKITGELNGDDATEEAVLKLAMASHLDAREKNNEKTEAIQ